MAAVVLLAATLGGCVGSAAGAAPNTTVRILGGAPAVWDPALQSDQETASVLANVDESLTAIDASGRVQPALAASWSSSADGRSITFDLRQGLTFSDGTPLGASDVVRSWDRLLDPQQPSPLASLLDPVAGVADLLAGHGTLAGVGITASGPLAVTVTFSEPASYFPSTAASPSLAVVPASIDASYDQPTAPRHVRGLGRLHPDRDGSHATSPSPPTPTTGPAGRPSRRSTW